MNRENDCMIPTESAQHLGAAVPTTACPFSLTNRLKTLPHHILQRRTDLRRESTNKPEGLEETWQNKDRSVWGETLIFGRFQHAYSTLQKNFSSMSSKELWKSFYMIHPWPSHSLSCPWNQTVLICPISTCAILLYFKHKASLSDTGTHSQRGSGHLPLPGKHRTCHSNYKLCFGSSVAPDSMQNYYSTYREGSAFSFHFKTQLNNCTK